MPDRVPLPRWLWIPAAIGAALIVLPLAGLLARADYARLWPLVTSDSALVALRLSLITALAATAICMVLGVPLAIVFARTRFYGRTVLRALALLPLVLPPVVGGIALLFTFGRMGLVGRYLEAAGIHIAFSTVAVVLAQAFVALPFMVMTVEGALNSLDTRFELSALALGAKPGYVLRRVTLPVLAPALVSGTVLCFARALGEFGATVTFAGSLEGTTRTLPLAIYLARETDPDSAVAMSLVLVVVAAIIVAATYGWSGRSKRTRTRSAAAAQSKTTTGEAAAGGAANSPALPTGSSAVSAGPPTASARSPAVSVGTPTLEREGSTPPATASPVNGLELRFALPERGVDVALEAPAGTVTAVIGPNGAGKSTTAGVLSGLLRPGEAMVRVGGATLGELRGGRGRWAKPWQRPIVQLSQRPWLFPKMSVLENAAFGLRARGMHAAQARQQARRMLARVGAAGLEVRLPDQLSGGQAQRVALARALLVAPQLVLLDEPLAALDAESQETIRALLRDVLAETTTLLITHDPADLVLTDRVAVLDDGRVVQNASLAEFASEPATEFARRFSAGRP